METFKVTLFKSYPFVKGQKIRIVDGKRRGDWEVVDINDARVTLRCPISKRQFEWERFCYLAEERENDAWPDE